MNIKVKYNQLIVETDIKAADFKRAQSFDPKVAAVLTEDNRILFSIAKGHNPQMSNKRVDFNQELNGRLAIVKELSHSDQVEKSIILDHIERAYGAGLAALAKYEDTIIKQIEETLAPIQDTLDNIEL